MFVRYLAWGISDDSMLIIFDVIEVFRCLMAIFILIFWIIYLFL